MALPASAVLCKDIIYADATISAGFGVSNLHKTPAVTEANRSFSRFLLDILRHVLWLKNTEKAL